MIIIKIYTKTDIIYETTKHIYKYIMNNHNVMYVMTSFTTYAYISIHQSIAIYNYICSAVPVL